MRDEQEKKREVTRSLCGQGRGFILPITHHLSLITKVLP